MKRGRGADLKPRSRKKASTVEKNARTKSRIEKNRADSIGSSTGARTMTSYLQSKSTATAAAAEEDSSPAAAATSGGDGDEEAPIVLGAADAGEDQDSHEGDGPPRRDATEDEEVKKEMTPPHDDADAQQSSGAVVDGNNNDVGVVELDEDASLEEASEAPDSPNARFAKLLRDQLSLEVSAQWSTFKKSGSSRS
jgi:hypothetical protein